MTDNLKKGCIFVVATPIGNLSDISKRAIESLKSSDIVICEDTRRTKNLLRNLDIPFKKMESYFDHNEKVKAPLLVEKIIDQGLTASLVSDAGTPCLADPGYRIVKEAKEKGLLVTPIPGPSSAISLISASGLPSDHFTFVGFLPRKKSKLIEEIKNWKKLGHCIVAHETAKRLKSSLEIIYKELPEARCSIGRELTKIYEEIVTCRVLEALAWCEAKQDLKGELSLYIDPGKAYDNETDLNVLMDRARALLDKGFTKKAAFDFLSPFFSGAKKKLYKSILDLS